MREGGKPQPEIMIPLVGAPGEFERLRVVVDEAAKRVIAESGQSIPYQIGTMIEVPRAALRANRIALNCDFFSFGTNDLTQMTYGYSRDDMGTFLPGVHRGGNPARGPVREPDQYGVGELVTLGTRRGREVKPKLKVGVCGEHGGDPRSIEFFHHAGLDYVSCSPFRVPVRAASPRPRRLTDQVGPSPRRTA
jgi:pyruvate,orthophosphate dikinase